MIKPLLLITFLVFGALAPAQSLHPDFGYASVGTYSSNFTDVFSFAANQASLSQLREPMAGIYSERRFMLKELSLYSAILALPMWSGGTALAMEFAGNSNYSQSQVALAYGRPLGEKAGLGIQFNYNRMHIAGYGNAGSINFEIGSILHVTEKLQAGCHVYNPFGGRFGNGTNEKMPSLYSFGLGYEMTAQLLIETVIEKEENQPVKVNVTLHYAPMKQFFLRAGIASAEGLSFMGAGLTWKKIRTGVCASWHSQLGFTPSLLLVFRFKDDQSTGQ